MDLKAARYSKQTLYAFNKLAELSFKREKPHNASLIAGIRATLSTIEYESEPAIDIITRIFQISILLKRSRLFTFAHTDQQLLDEVRTSTWKKDARKCLLSPMQSFFNIFK